MCTIVTTCSSTVSRGFVWAEPGCLANPQVLIIQVTSAGFVSQMTEGPSSHHSKYSF